MSVNRIYLNTNMRNLQISKNSSDMVVQLHKAFLIKKDVSKCQLSNIIIPSEILKTINKNNNTFFITANNNTNEINLTIGDYDISELVIEMQLKIRTATNNNNFVVSFNSITSKFTISSNYFLQVF